MRTETPLDQRDTAYIAAAMKKRNDKYPQVGDWVIFSDGTKRRVSYNWPEGVQTSKGGSYYLMSTGHMSFSGGLHGITPYAALTDTGTTRAGSCWVFHHNVHQAHNGVDTAVDVKVWRADTEPTP